MSNCYVKFGVVECDGDTCVSCDGAPTPSNTELLYAARCSVLRRKLIRLFQLGVPDAVVAGWIGERVHHIAWLRTGSALPTMAEATVWIPLLTLEIECTLRV